MPAFTTINESFKLDFVRKLVDARARQKHGADACQ